MPGGSAEITGWCKCWTCGATWPPGGTSRCVCGQPAPRHSVCSRCGEPIPLRAHLEWMRNMNRARVDLALTFKTEVGPAEKYCLTSGADGSMEPQTQCEGCAHGPDRICLLGRLVFPGEWCDWRAGQ